ncbi:SUMF1/EgtB/PvdO family nonheme iron enzyme [Nonomuraea sp. NPDC046802]|uniref:formylglycine-generating enzyme family protein n=1 Tax=Nonomuraea sp. NPDC046802 TaxID=3154919 RepID=UPI0033FF259F
MRVCRLAAGVVVTVLTATGCSAGSPSAAPEEPAGSPTASPPPPTASAGGSSADRPAVRIGDLWFDATEVTVGKMRRFATETSLRTAAEREGGGFEFVSGWTRRPGWTYLQPHGTPVGDSQPAVHLSWAEARDYCQWAGGRLPTAAEWRAAAYTESRATPTAPFTSGDRYEYATGTGSAGANLRGDTDGFAVAAPVGSFPAGVNGLYDMSANVWEWLADAQGEDRLTAGGSWWYGPEQTTAEAFQYKAAAFYALYVGFRCVYESAPQT